ncbi:leucine-rich repeats and immunoglobulin-like domains 2 [Brachionus plicatilis]|uniref:Leucine-rich repeats and immunoglobulin-like domains 2 n=1 Tax=Brachionus plicatilis TaxID=10195 RepID=A0A3M7SHP0_BRAPC|nr:leucine-rich repeats and immunoglobulin-like domains 2 [Brachionus plicatilis]
MFKLELSVFIGVVVCSCSVLLATFEYEPLVIEKVCNHTILSQIDNHYTSILLKCNWTKFIDFNLNKKLPIDEQNFIFYTIEFSAARGAGERLDAKYGVLKANLFRNLKVKSLSLRGLGIEAIEKDAFDNSSFFYATHLDLSSNRLGKIAASLFDNMASLEHLNLSNNLMSFATNNFVQCRRLKSLDLSSNRIQYIAHNQFNGLSSIELVDLSNNSIDKIDACTFSNMNIKPIAKLYRPPLINLHQNPVVCDCDAFFVNRVLKFRLNLTCSAPLYYVNRNFFDLKAEDPSQKCKYNAIEKLCDVNSMSPTEVTLICVLSVIFVLIVVCVCCFCAHNVNKTNRIRIMRHHLNELAKPKQTKLYYQLNQDANETDQTNPMIFVVFNNK